MCSSSSIIVCRFSSRFGIFNFCISWRCALGAWLVVCTHLKVSHTTTNPVDNKQIHTKSTIINTFLYIQISFICELVNPKRFIDWPKYINRRNKNNNSNHPCLPIYIWPDLGSYIFCCGSNSINTTVYLSVYLSVLPKFSYNVIGTIKKSTLIGCDIIVS